ncbi:MAG: hypothetical protein ACLGIW_18325, partial [Gammaproteobacteria bacterium]
TSSICSRDWLSFAQAERQFFAADADVPVSIHRRIVASLPLIHTFVRFTRATACKKNPAQTAG